MKIWPFDLAAEKSGGSRSADLRPGLAVLEAIRNEVGDDIKIYLELHGQWTLSGATRLLHAVEAFDLAWAEDPIRSDHPDALAELRRRTDIPLAVGESVGTGNLGYKTLFERNAIDTAILDLGWCGGISGGKHTAHLAQSHGLPVALHDCTGPIALATAVQLATATPNVEVQEMARAFYYGWYQDIATGLPQLRQGTISAASAPGHGVELHPEFLHRADTSRRITRLSGGSGH